MKQKLTFKILSIFIIISVIFFVFVKIAHAESCGVGYQCQGIQFNEPRGEPDARIRCKEHCGGEGQIKKLCEMSSNMWCCECQGCPTNTEPLSAEYKTCLDYCKSKNQEGGAYSSSYPKCCKCAEPPEKERPFVPPSLQIPIPGLTLTTEESKLKFCTECTDPDVADAAECPKEKCKSWAYSIPWIGEYIAAFYKWAVGALAILAVIMIMISGIRWLIAGGSPEKITSAKQSIVAAISGLIFMLIIHQVLAMINPELTILKPIVIGVIKKVGETQRQWESGPVPAGALGRINGLIDDYRAAAEAENVPWTLLAATDYMESSNRSNASSLNGCPMEGLCDESYCPGMFLNKCTKNKGNESKCCCKNRYCFCNSQSDSVTVCAGLCDASSGKRGDLRCTAKILQQKARQKFRGRGDGALTKEMNDALNPDGTPNFGGTILNAAYLFNGAGYDSESWLKKYSNQTGYNKDYKGISISAYVMDEFYGPNYHLFIMDIAARGERGSRPGLLVMFLKLNKPENYDNRDINTGKLISLN